MGVVPVPDTGDGLLGDMVWRDDNGNGVQDASEPGLEDIQVDLQTCAGALVESTNTNAQGKFAFSSIGTGQYRLQFQLPFGYRYSPERAGSDFRLDSNANEQTGLTGCYDMSNGWQRRAVDAGMVPDSSSSADTVIVYHAIFLSASNILWVRAESDVEPIGSATIKARGVINGIDVELGSVRWKPNKGFYQATFRGLAQAPESITLVSDAGGEATAPVLVR